MNEETPRIVNQREQLKSYKYKHENTIKHSVSIISLCVIGGS